MTTATQTVSRIFAPLTDAFTPELAKKLVELRADDDTTARVEYLRGGANAGTLTTEEEAEYRSIVGAIDLISVLQLKARHYLRQHDS